MTTWLGLSLVAMSFLSSPLASRDWCPAAQVDVLVWHEWSHDAGYWVRGVPPFRPWAIEGDKWDGSGAGVRAARAGLVGETWLAAATLDPCVTRAHTLSVGAYVGRAFVDPHNAGDFDPIRHHRGQYGFAALAPALIFESLAAWVDEGEEGAP